MKKSITFISAILWLILSVFHFVEGNLEKGIVFIICAVGLIVVEIISLEDRKISRLINEISICKTVRKLEFGEER